MATNSTVFSRKRSMLATSSLALAAVALVLVPAASASAATTISGPIDLGTATSFGVLAGSTITNTNTNTLPPTTITGDVGLSPGTSITGFDSVVQIDGTVHATDSVALQAKKDLVKAYNVASSLTPVKKGLKDLTGQSLVPGVYSGGALSLTGELTLAGTADSVWVFQAASTLKIASGAEIVLTGGATSCNVFWKVGSSATIGTSADFVGTVMAKASITANTQAVIDGRLFASSGAVTLHNNVLTRSQNCADASGSVVSSSAVITSDKPTSGTADTPYSDTVRASGDTPITYEVTRGELPTGLTLNETTGRITGTPTESGRFTFVVTATGASGAPDSARYTIVIAAAGGGTGEAEAAAAAALLAETGADPALLIGGAAAFGAAGLLLLVFARRTSRKRSQQH